MRQLPFLPRFVVAVVLAALFIVSTTARAQESSAFKDPALLKSRNAALGGLAARLAHPAIPAAAVAGTTPATLFKPSGSRLTLDAFIGSLAKTADERNGLRQVLVATFDAYEKAANEAGHRHDVAAALTFYLSAHYMAFHDVAEVSDATQDAVLAQLHAALDTPEMRSAPNADKQRLYEFFVLMGGFTGAMRELGAENKDAELKKLSHRLGAEGLTFVFKVAPERVGLSATGLNIAPVTAAAAAAAVANNAPVTSTTGGGGGGGGGGTLADISYALPSGWTETRSEGAVIVKATLEGYTEPRECTLIVTPALAKTGSLADSLRRRWTEMVLPLFDGETKPFPIAVNLPGGMSCAYGAEEMHAKQNKGMYGVSCYAIDAGGGAVVVVTALYPDQLYGMYANKKYTGALVQFLGSLRIKGAPTGRPLVTGNELVGYWSNAVTSFAQYVDSRGDYAGDASMATGTTFTFHPDGTYSHVWVLISARARIKQTLVGKYHIEDGTMIVMNPSDGDKSGVYRFRGLCKDERGTMLVLGNRFDKPELFRGLSRYEARFVLTTPPKN